MNEYVSKLWHLCLKRTYPIGSKPAHQCVFTSHKTRGGRIRRFLMQAKCLFSTVTVDRRKQPDLTALTRKRCKRTDTCQPGKADVTTIVRQISKSSTSTSIAYKHGSRKACPRSGKCFITLASSTPSTFETSTPRLRRECEYNHLKTTLFEAD